MQLSPSSLTSPSPLLQLWAHLPTSSTGMLLAGPEIPATPAEEAARWALEHSAEKVDCLQQVEQCGCQW